MSVWDDLKQKMSGLEEQLEGEANIRRGKGIKGGMQKAKGKIKEEIADTKLKMKSRKLEM